MLKKALIIANDNATDCEVFYPLHRLKEDGFEVDICSNNIDLICLKGYKFQSKLTFDSLFLHHINKYDLLIIPGGVLNLERIRQEPAVIKFISEWNKQGKAIGSICWAAQLLISAKCVKDRKISGYYSIKEDIENAGGIYVDEPAVVDGNIISTSHYKHLGPWMKKVLEVYYERNTNS